MIKLVKLLDLIYETILESSFYDQYITYYDSNGAPHTIQIGSIVKYGPGHSAYPIYLRMRDQLSGAKQEPSTTTSSPITPGPTKKNPSNKLKLYSQTRPFTAGEIVDAVGEYFENEYTYNMFPKLASTPDELAEMIRNSPTVVLTKSQLKSLENSDVEEMFGSKDPQKTLYDMMSQQDRVADLNRILDGIEEKANLPMPIVIKHSNGYYLMGGNSRLSALAAAGYTMPVKLLTYTG